MGGKSLADTELQIKDKQVKPPFPDNARLKLAQGSGSAVAGIGEQFASGFLLAGVDGFESFDRQIDLAAYLEVGNRLWQALLWLGFTLAVSAALLRRLKLPSRAAGC